MKLELKHLAPYLPYKLKAKFMHPFVKHQKIGIINNAYNLDDDVKLSIDYSDDEHIWMYKPILRPLSDLNKEIKVNGNLFTPNHHPLFKIFISADMDWFIDNCPFFVDYGQVQKLLEWHFDVFGLIDAGLAIDINTL
jgi:hypothetical protein